MLEGNGKLLHLKVLRMSGPYTNTHEYPGNDLYMKCSHGDIERKWLEKGSKASHFLWWPIFYIQCYILGKIRFAKIFKSLLLQDDLNFLYL